MVELRDGEGLTFADGGDFRIEGEQSQMEQNRFRSGSSRCEFATSMCVGSVMYMDGNFSGGRFDTIPSFSSQQPLKKIKESSKAFRKRLRKPLKAEAKALVLLREMIGYDQWKVYRKTNRILVKPGRYFWMIGNIFGTYNKNHPFSGKPDVVRIDNPKKLHSTSFCVMQFGGEETPYTDKVLLFCLSLIHDEKDFVKTVNRTGEKTFNKMAECAVWDIDGHGSSFSTIDALKDFSETIREKIMSVL